MTDTPLIDGLLQKGIEESIQTLTTLDSNAGTPEAVQEIRALLTEAMKRGSKAKAARLQLEIGLRFALPSYAEALREVIARTDAIMAEAEESRQRITTAAEAERQKAEALCRRAAEEADFRARANAEAKVKELVDRRQAEILALASEREALERERAALLEPFAQARLLLDDFLDKAGYEPETDYRTGKRKRREVPSPIMCHAATFVAAIAGTNPVSVQFGSQSGTK